MAGSTRASSVTVAFTPPMNKTARPDLAAARARGPSRAAGTSGSTAHGATRPAIARAVVEPMTIVNVGQSTNARPARILDRSEPIRSAVASLTKPRNPALTRVATHNRSVSHTGRFSRWPAR